MKQDLKLPKTYKTLLMLALVLGPFYWLAFTDDGQRRTDLALMALLGHPEFNPAVESFNGSLSEARLREVFPKLDWRCGDGTNPFGDRLCKADIGSFNQIPASSVTFFFAGSDLRAAKIVYRHAYHALLSDWLGRRLGGRGAAPPVAVESKEGVKIYPVDDGEIFVRQGALGEDEEPAILWISRAALDARH
ncbi:hypothetical protein ThidrDRAFT_2866 [Thiorhodococcus drewsii AZ1]|uniref:Uncharacterized protein n=1 Tax=Thiorhodococcus drewsii AZ1 TaxID=765913 RepID=G2E3K3_9GAMM|nr:hypothetical protein [Thiorhodococcus drewsii]EGV30116.1 hypothetical protein ThidrDRAFT_2866 [Thiorhodococcus drewsii AZ1]